MSNPGYTSTIFNENEIVRILDSEDVHTTRQTVAKFIRKHKLIKFLIYFAIFCRKL